MEPLVTDWIKEKRKWRKSFASFMFIADNSILSRLCHNYFSQVNSIDLVPSDDEFFWY